MSDNQPTPLTLDDWERDMLLRLLADEAARARTRQRHCTEHRDASWYWTEMVEGILDLSNRLADSKVVPRRV